MLVPRIRERLMDALEGTPTVLEVLTAGLSPGDPRWEFRENADRFTLREVFAHLADYDVRWLGYLDSAMGATAKQPAQVAPFGPDDVAAGRHYDESDPGERLAALRESRATLVARLHALPEDAWTAHAIASPRHGQLNLDELATLFAAHDGYHVRQVAEYVFTKVA